MRRWRKWKIPHTARSVERNRNSGLQGNRGWRSVILDQGDAKEALQCVSVNKLCYCIRIRTSQVRKKLSRLELCERRCWISICQKEKERKIIALIWKVLSRCALLGHASGILILYFFFYAKKQGCQSCALRLCWGSNAIQISMKLPVLGPSKSLKYPWEIQVHRRLDVRYDSSKLKRWLFTYERCCSRVSNDRISRTGG